MNDETWERILGKEIYSEINRDECNRLQEKLMQQKNIRLYQIYEQTETYYWGKLTVDNFDFFYRFFSAVAIKWIEGIEEFQAIRKADCECLIIENIYERIVRIPMRCLIAEINDCREKGILSGGDSSEQYQNYNEKFLKSPDYIKSLCQKYPEMLRLLLLRIEQTVYSIKDIMQAFEKDKEELINVSGNPSKDMVIQGINLGIGDVHTNGKAVARVYLKNGNTLMYKPRKIHKNQIYQNLTEWFYEEMHLLHEGRWSLTKEEYGWECYVESHECANNIEVQNFFYRLGIQLFICYLTDTSDVHCGNLIANGEFPELIDLETVPGNNSFSSEIESEEVIVRQFLRESVMHIGILPIPSWGNNTEQGNLNVIHSVETCTTPFKLAIAKNYKSSEIKIVYEQRKMQLPNSLPIYNKKIVDATHFIEEICEGFYAAYNLGLKKTREVINLFAPIYAERSRHLIRHTQQYEMYLSLSLSPEFMKSTLDRIYLFHILKKRVISDRKYIKLFPYELETLMNLEVPIYYFDGNSNDLIAGDKTFYKRFFMQTAYQNFQEKVSNLSNIDLQRQMMLIRLAMALYLKGNKCSDGILSTKNPVIEVVQAIIQQLSVLRINKESGPVWIQVKYCNKALGLQPVGMDLYDGAMGIAVLFAILNKTKRNKKSADLVQEMDRKIFLYTDTILKNKQNISSRENGMFTGAGAIVYGYLLLYQITDKQDYIRYAEKHAMIAHSMTEECEADLLSGRAGWIIVLSKLYQITKQKCYLDMAVEEGERLWTQALPMETGRGWICSGQLVPLAGMAHGNSGGILAYTQLMELTDQKKYVDRICELMAYEDSLFSVEKGNWIDMRKKNSEADGRRYMNAWCHGASGILLSRVKLGQRKEFKKNKQVQYDIENGIRSAMQWDSEENFCICHGLAGRYLILKECGEILQNQALKNEAEKIKKYIKDNIGKIPVHEKYNLGLMSGIVGIGVALLVDGKLDILC